LDGLSIPFRSAGTDVLRVGKMEAMYARIRHHIETEANCMMVRVTGCGSAVRMDFEDVLVKAEVMYHAMQSACADISVGH
jgi:hypothetical protein